LAHEIEVKSDWGKLLKSVNWQIQRQSVDSVAETFVLDPIFSQAECEALIAASEKHGFGATNYPKSYRGNLRLITTDASLTSIVFDRIRAFLPPTVTDGGAQWELVGLNEMWRLAKYYPGDVFGAHCDARFERSKLERSMFTVNVYMNGGFEGGRTRFIGECEESGRPPIVAAIVPAAGRCLVFRQPPGQRLLHDGEQLRTGNKYLFRTDAMYRKIPAAAENVPCPTHGEQAQLNPEDAAM